MNSQFKEPESFNHYSRYLPNIAMLLVLCEEEARLYYFNASSLTCLKSIEADIHVCETEERPPSAGSPIRDDRKEALRYIFYHKVDHELSLLLKEYPVPVFVTGKNAMLNRFGRWTKNVKNIGSYLQSDPENIREDDLPKLIAIVAISSLAKADHLNVTGSLFA